MIIGLFLLFVLLVVAVGLVLLEHRKPKEPRDYSYRVVHFTLRLALTFGIGVVIVAVVLVLASLGVIPDLRSG